MDCVCLVAAGQCEAGYHRTVDARTSELRSTQARRKHPLAWVSRLALHMALFLRSSTPRGSVSADWRPRAQEEKRSKVCRADAPCSNFYRQVDPPEALLSKFGGDIVCRAYIWLNGCDCRAHKKVAKPVLVVRVSPAALLSSLATTLLAEPPLGSMVAMAALTQQQQLLALSACRAGLCGRCTPSSHCSKNACPRVDQGFSCALRLGRAFS